MGAKHWCMKITGTVPVDKSYFTRQPIYDHEERGGSFLMVVSDLAGFINNWPPGAGS